MCSGHTKADGQHYRELLHEASGEPSSSHYLRSQHFMGLCGSITGSGADNPDFSGPQPRISAPPLELWREQFPQQQQRKFPRRPRGVSGTRCEPRLPRLPKLPRTRWARRRLSEPQYIPQPSGRKPNTGQCTQGYPSLFQSLITVFGKRTICLRFNQGKSCPNGQGGAGSWCTKPNDSKKMWHICAQPMPNGKACGRTHTALEHK